MCSYDHSSGDRGNRHNIKFVEAGCQDFELQCHRMEDAAEKMMTDIIRRAIATKI